MSVNSHGLKNVKMIAHEVKKINLIVRLNGLYVLPWNYIKISGDHKYTSGNSVHKVSFCMASKLSVFSLQLD